MLPLLWVSLSFLLGVALASKVRLSVTVWIGLAATCLLWQMVGRRLNSIVWQRLPAWGAAWKPPVPAAVLLVCLFLGVARYQAAQPELSPDEIAWWNDSQENWIVEGIVIEPPEIEDLAAHLVVEAYRLRPSDTLLFTPVHGKLLVNVPIYGDWRYGD